MVRLTLLEGGTAESKGSRPPPCDTKQDGTLPSATAVDSVVESGTRLFFLAGRYGIGGTGRLNG